MFSKKAHLRAAAAAVAVNLVTSGAVTADDTEETVDEVVVTAHPLSPESLAQPVSTLQGKELERALAPSLADTLRDVPGVHSASFGSAVGRPVLRGMGGPRVKTLEDRIDSMDVSVSSPDHATTIDPFIANSIEVLKGPSTLLYGTGAIGGIVNVNSNRIPNALSDGTTLSVELRGADNADQRTAAAHLDTSAGNLAFHLDFFSRDADEFEIPGYAESARLRALEEEEEHDEEEGEEHEEEEEAFGILPGSQLEARGGAAGVSFVGERGFIGFAVSTYDAEYGLPGGHGHHEEEEHEEGEEEHEEEEEGNPILDLDQTRVDLEGELLAPFAGINSLNVRLGFNDYEHVELEGNGEAGTVFDNKAVEGRVELVHEAAFGFEGATGVQFSTREFSAIGEEAFVQPVDTDTIGVFYVGQRSFGDTSFEIGGRFEHVEHQPTSGSRQTFDMFAGSVGLIKPLNNGWTISGQLDRSNRAPVAEELYSDGPHLATQSFEIGDQGLGEETATNVSATLSYEQDNLRFGINAFYTDFSDFIFESATGEEEDELPVFQWQQADATFSGFEADVSWDAMTWDNGGLTLNAGFDAVRARLDSGTNRNLPRIPPMRWRLGGVATWSDFLAEVTYTAVDSQSDVAFEELATDSYNDLRIHIAYGFTVGDSDVEVFVSGRNLTDDEQRNHTSFIKDLAPNPGRTIEAGISVRL